MLSYKDNIVKSKIANWTQNTRNEKKDLQEPVRDFADEGNNWFEQTREFVTSLTEAGYILREGNLESKKEFLKKIGSNFILKMSRLKFSMENLFQDFFSHTPYPNWQPHRDLNPGLQNENLMSWARLDDGAKNCEANLVRGGGVEPP